MRFVNFLLFTVLAQGSTTILRVDSSSTQALAWVQAPTSSTCTVQVSESVSLTPLIDDVNPTLFINANTEAVRTTESYVNGANTIRKIRIGLRTAALSPDGYWHSRALSSSQQYYLSVTCDATATTTFSTKFANGISPEGPPTSAIGFGQMANCEFADFTKPCIEPHSGMKIYTANPNNWGSSQVSAIVANRWLGGTGWTNLANIIPYGAPGGATTGNTNPLTLLVDVSLYNDQLRLGGGYWPYDNFTDLAVDLTGIAGSGIGDNPKVQICITGDSGQSCLSPYQPGTLPTSTGAVTVPNLTDGSAAIYPTAYFAGWGKRLQRNLWPKQGMVTASGTVVTLTQALTNPFGTFEAIGSSQYSVNGYFDQDWVAGTKIFIASSSPTCTNNLCTIASMQSATKLTLVENLGAFAEQYYHSAAFGVIINKKNATNTVTFTVRFRLAKSYPHNLGFNGGMSTSTVTSSDGITGFPAIFPSMSVTPRLGPGALYFIGTTGPNAPVIRMISTYSNSNCISTGADCPNSGLAALGPLGPQFDQTDVTKSYFMVKSNSGKGSIFQAQYTAGTWLEYTNSYSSVDWNPPHTNELTITNLTPGSGDINSQVIANVPNYKPTFFGDVGDALTVGMVGPFILLQTAQATVAWIHAFCVNSVGPCGVAPYGPGKWYRSWLTSDSTLSSDPSPGSGFLRYAGQHAVTPTFGSSAANGYTFQIATTILNESRSDHYNAGPFSGTITAMYRSGSPSATTTLPWPIDSSYDGDCPAVPAWLSSRVVNGQCVRVRGTLPCSATPAAGEAADRPCPYNAAYSYLGGLKIGDTMKDNCGGCTVDNEGLMVLTDPVLISGNTYEWYMLRDSNPSYCTALHDGNGGLVTHNNGWGYFMVARDSCALGSLVLIDIVNNTGSCYNQNINRGHGGTKGDGPGLLSRIGAGSQLSDFSFVYNTQSNRPAANIDLPRDGFTPSAPKFAGYQSSDNIPQSYADCKSPNATAFLKQYCFDFSHGDSQVGSEPEFPRQYLGGCLQGSGGCNVLTPEGGTIGVYLVNINGTPDIKHQNLNVWVGRRWLIDGSSATTGNTITDATPWAYCYTYNAGECRVGSAQGKLYVSVPTLDTLSGATYAKCWASQMNLNFPCPLAGPTHLGQARYIYIGSPDAGSQRQVYLGWLGMGPEQQQVYSSFLPTPDGLYGLFSGFLLNGYHTGISMAKLPTPIVDTVSRATYIPQIVSRNAGTNVKIRFWYDEMGGFCRSRAEACYATANTINEATPFYFAGESFSTQSGAWTIHIPADPGKLLYYRIVDGGIEGPTQSILVN